MDLQTVTELSNKYLMQTYRRAPVAFVTGQGARVVDTEGKTYLDFVAGIAVTVLGHNHPALTAAIRAQAARLLVEHSAFARAFFCNSGAEANEAAIKLARKYGKSQRDDRFGIIVADHSFHGRTLGSLAATAQPKYQHAFEPLPAGFHAVPFNDLQALEGAITDATCAVMLEPIQGEGGIHPASPDYLRGVRKVCDARGLLLMLDEVETGIGRTGRLFADEHYGVVPDVITLAKGL